jgi:hypothetical protein
MDISCSCDWGDPPQFYNATKPRARKQYRCYECAGPILAGERYERVSAKYYNWDGVDVFKTCARCHDIRQWIKNNIPCHCILHGNQDEQNDETVMEARRQAPEETKGLLFGYLRRKHLREKFNTAHYRAAQAHTETTS